MRKESEWSEEDKNTIKDFIVKSPRGKISVKDVADKLPHYSLSKVKSQIYRLGLSVGGCTPWTVEEDRTIRDFLTASSGADISVQDVANQLPHRSFIQVKGRIQRLGLRVKNREEWTEAENDVVRNLYSTTTATALAKILTRHSSNAIKARANSMGLFKKVVYTKNEKFFAVPNVTNCAVAGFIAADGNIQSNKPILNIKISVKDIEFLKSIFALLEFNGPMLFQTACRKRYESTVTGSIIPEGMSYRCCLSTVSEDWCNDLSKHWNITPRKTATLMPPNLTDNRLKMAYISGLTCGDGWISKTVNDSGHLSFGMGFTGTKDLLEWVQSTFNSLVPNMDAKKLSDNKSPNCRDYCVWGATFYWLAKMFLSLDIPRLDRKWDLARMFIERVEAGNVSARMLTQIEKKRPTDAVLAEFGIISRFSPQISLPPV